MRAESPQFFKEPIDRLVFELAKLPGIGEKTATRLAYFILKQDENYGKSLAEAILSARKGTLLCKTCLTFTSQEMCSICVNANRDRSIICVVEKPSDIAPIEGSSAHAGVYHVLHGSLSPLEGIGPDDLKIRELLHRIRESGQTVREVILALNPSVEGEATQIYLGRMLSPLGVKITQLAYGLPMGGQLEYSDRQTIGRAVQNRVEVRT